MNQTHRQFHGLALPSLLLPSAIIPAGRKKGKCEFCHIFTHISGTLARFLQKPQGASQRFASAVGAYPPKTEKAIAISDSFQLVERQAEAV